MTELVVWGKVSTCIGEFLGFRHKLRGYLHQLSCQLSASPSNLIDMPFMDTHLLNIIISFYYVVQWVIDYRIINYEQTQMVRQRMGHKELEPQLRPTTLQIGDAEQKMQ